ncbi:hypothetical protein [Pseudonocardia sp. HH130630-07]|uniref:hypothetical protein n=1 Tax=Pseudonocardia sp. HH130630-07 TaxID=1690815 RepID=UPI0008152718|nr:hypothetical protein [Pseudonocardia sp. HH130630-07]ANY10697.1 hypothetical protein AFB00_30285 [Pseudonocardia sp. HH130630-07]
MSTAAEDPQVVARSLSAGRPVLTRLRQHGLTEDLTWVLPLDLAPDLDELDDVPVVHSDVPSPMLAHWVRRQGDAR